MVGGTVIEVCEHPTRPDVLFVDCAEMPRGRSKPDTCAIYVEKNEISERIEIGDSVWWQGRLAMWTPKTNRTSGLKSGVDFDIQIPRVGYSGASHPLRQEEPAK